MSSALTTELLARIRETGAETIVLQFPEGLKRRAPATARDLESHGFSVIISGNPCWGACDLALDALAMADLLVHFGHAPVEDRPGVLYEHVAHDFDMSALEGVLPLLEGTRVGLVTTIQHVHLAGEISGWLEDRGISCLTAAGGRRAPYPGQVLGCSFAAAKNTGASEFLYVGTGLFHPLGVALATGARTVAFDPYTGRGEVVDTSRLLRRRFALIERAKGAETAGILLSTKSGQQRQDLARSLAALDPRAVIIALFEVTPDSLLNLGCDCYVNTACPRLAYDDQDRFSAPLLTPSEWEIACGARDWEDYQVDEIE